MPDEVKNEIEEMLNAISGKSSVEDTGDDKGKDEGDKVDDKVIDDKKDGEVDEVIDEKKDDNKQEEIDDKLKEEENKQKELEEKVLADKEKDKVIEDLRRQLEEKNKKVEEDKVKEEPLNLESHDFIGDLDPEDIMRDKDSLNKLLNSVYSKGVLDAKNLASEKVLLSIPNIVRTNLQLMEDLKKTSDKFYEENKDLSPFKKVVAAVFEDLISKNPDKKYTELLKEVATESRRRLELHKEIVKTDKGQGKPRLPNKGSDTRANPDNKKPDISPLQKELDEMNKAVRR